MSLRLCRYMTHPALANEPVQTHAAGQVVLERQNAGRDGTKYVAVSRLESRQRHIDQPLFGIEFCKRYFNCGPPTAHQSPSIQRQPA